MILVGNQRGGARDLALHLMKDENERVELHELRGFVAEDLRGAFQESYALSQGTRCKQHLFSLSLSPPPEERVENLVFEEAVDRIEKRLGLDQQPRAIVFHEKDGRRHAHAVWCRIDPENMRAVQLSHTKTKLQDVARELYIEHDWRMPRGFIDKELRDPRNFSLEEWQQAKRARQDPRHLKTMFQDAWATSDSQASFAHALDERGFVLAKGDRRGFVAVDHEGEVYAVARWVGLKTKQVKDRLGSPDNLPSVCEAHERAASVVSERLNALREEQTRLAQEKKARLAEEHRRALEAQDREAKALAAKQAERAKREESERQERFRKGLIGLIDRLTGKRKRTEAQNSSEAALAQRRDQAERQRQRLEHAHHRRLEERKVISARRSAEEIDAELSQDAGRIEQAARDAREQARKAFKQTRRNSDRPKRQRRARDGPKLER